MITGLAFGGIYLATKSLWVPIAAHVSFDLTAVAIIYRNAEALVAHLVYN